jgi:hypothetical protein
MIVHYHAPGGDVLLMRPQTAAPHQGERVVVTESPGLVRYYRVQTVEWPLTLPAEERQYYSLLDAAEEVVRVYLREEVG